MQISPIILTAPSCQKVTPKTSACRTGICIPHCCSPGDVLLTLLSFSPSVCGMRVFRDWKPALMLCIRRLSLLLAISLRIRRSWSRWVSGVNGMLAKL